MTDPNSSAPPQPFPDGADVTDLRERWHRALAEAENTRKAADRKGAAERQAERLAVSAAWLPVLDHLDLAQRGAVTAFGAAGVGVGRERRGVSPRSPSPRCDVGVIGSIFCVLTETSCEWSGLRGYGVVLGQGRGRGGEPDRLFPVRAAVA